MNVSISIDIGTSYSSVCMLREGSAEDRKVVPVDISTTAACMYGSKYSLPSAAFLSGDKLLLGQAAMNSRFQNPQNFVSEFKRHLGEDVPLRLGDRSYLPEDFYTAIFEHMKHRVEELTGGEQIKKTYITYPASYGTGKQKKILSAAKAAGLFEAELVDEPTSAAMYYDAQGLLEENKNLLVYDFGGGTFDAALICREDGAFRLLTEPMGLPQCGGTDIDRLIYADIHREMEKSNPDLIAQVRQNELANMRFESQMAQLAVQAKEHLSAAETFSEGVAVGLDYIPYFLTRERYEQMITPLVEKTIEPCRTLLEKAGLKIEELSAVLLVGGTTRIPLVRAKVRQFAGEGKVLEADDLELAVSAGALERLKQNDGVDEEVLQELTGMGRRYLYGEGVARDAARGVILLKQAADLEYGPAQLLLASCLEGGIGTDQNPEKALRLYERAAGQGEIRAQCRLGLLYTTGIGLTKADPQKADYWNKEAVGHQDARTLYEIAREYENDASCAEALQEAAYLYTQAAEMESADACLRIGIFYLEGRAVERNPDTALQYFLKAAIQGNSEAAEIAGRLYEGGDGVSRDLLQARFWYNTAADKGRVVAQRKMAEFCAQGIGGAKDEVMAAAWYLKAAENGDAEAAFQRAERCGRGIGTAVDMEEARKWYKMAADQGYPQAQQRLYDLTRLIRQLEEARKQKEAESETEKPSDVDNQKKHVETSADLNERLGRLVWEYTLACPGKLVSTGKIIPAAEVNSRLLGRLRIRPDEQIYIWGDTTPNARTTGAGRCGYAVTSRAIHCMDFKGRLAETSWEEFLHGKYSVKRNIMYGYIELHLQGNGIGDRMIFISSFNPVGLDRFDRVKMRNKVEYMQDQYFKNLQQYLREQTS